jgi:hypothetical protein
LVSVSGPASNPSTLTPDGDQPLDAHPEVDAADVEQAAHEQAGGHRQGEGEGDL